MRLIVINAVIIIIFINIIIIIIIIIIILNSLFKISNVQLVLYNLEKGIVRFMPI